MLSRRRKPNLSPDASVGLPHFFRDLAMSAPYLHDGRAMTLEEIWTLYSPDDKHGVTSDLGKDGLNDLIEYLKTI